MLSSFVNIFLQQLFFLYVSHIFLQISYGLYSATKNLMTDPVEAKSIVWFSAILNTLKTNIFVR